MRPTKAFENGQAGYVEGTDNPHLADSELAAEWDAGYLAAAKDAAGYRAKLSDLEVWAEDRPW